MFVMSEKFVTEHRGIIRNITIYGQEGNQAMWKLSKMNLAIRNINSQFLSWITEGRFCGTATLTSRPSTPRPIRSRHEKNRRILPFLAEVRGV
jgi:hypothetical protein